MKNSSSPSQLPHVDAFARVGIIASSYYPTEMEELVRGAIETLIAAGMQPQNVTEYRPYGSFEIPLIGAALAKAGTVDALIGLGIIVEGDTHHARLLADQTARAMMDIQVQYGIPFAFEVLYVNSLEQAKERLDKGREAATAVLHSLALLAKIRS